MANAEFNAAAGGAISMWPGSLGMAATFDPVLVTRFGQIAATEYRALGITTALSPQVDIATDPRWSRASGTFGEDPYLAAAMASAYCNGFQTSTGYDADPNGWGMNSVNAMVKHWPGGGSGEAGRDAHYAIGKFAVYPGKQFKTHFIPFTEGAFKLQGKTMMASAIMPYYTISWDQDSKNKENVGNSYNRYIIQDLLRDKYKYDGVACTDWGITGDETVLDNFTAGKPWGVEKLSVAERHYKVLMAGVDQFGGNNEAKPIIEAYAIGSKEHGEAWMRARMEQSAVRLLKNIFRVGLFEFPYVIPETTKSIVGQPSYMKAGYEAQLKSMVLLKNQKQTLPLKTGIKVYVPIGYSPEDVKKGGNGYLPISLQYGEYKATEARAVSIAGGDPLENFTNRSYKDKTNKAINHTDLGMVTDTYDKMKGKPVIVSVTMDNPMVFQEFESKANAILVNFRVQDQAILDILTGKAEPSGLLPMQMPADMAVVEKQAEDAPHDMRCHKDAAGNVYTFGFGLNWKGVIQDARTAKYVPKKK
nr:glycoside hydrolase family 3 protein [Haliscomenobacter sp.]